MQIPYHLHPALSYSLRLCAALLQKDALEQSSATLTHNLLLHEKSESEALRCEQEVAEGLRYQWEQLQENHVLSEDQFGQCRSRIMRAASYRWVGDRLLGKLRYRC